MTTNRSLYIPYKYKASRSGLEGDKSAFTKLFVLFLLVVSWWRGSVASIEPALIACMCAARLPGMSPAALPSLQLSLSMTGKRPPHACPLQ